MRNLIEVSESSEEEEMTTKPTKTELRQINVSAQPPKPIVTKSVVSVSRLEQEAKNTNALLTEILKRSQETPQWTNSLTNLMHDLGMSIKELIHTLSGMPKLENPEFISIRTLTVTSAGTPVQFPPLLIPYDKEVSIKALSTNTGIVYIAGSKQDAGDSTRRYPLVQSEAIELKIKNLKNLWLDAATSNDSVAWIVEVKGEK